MYGTPMTRYEAVYLPADKERLASILSRNTTGLRVWQDGRIAAELHLGPWKGDDAGALVRRLDKAGVDTSAIMDVEVFSGAGAWEAADPVFSRPDTTPGGTLFLCLNGPSFDKNARQLLANRPGVVTMCVNNGAHGFRPDFWTCVDAPHRFMESIWTDGKIVKYVPETFFKKTYERTADGKPKPGGALVESCHGVRGYARSDVFRTAEFFTSPAFLWGNSKERGGGRSVMLPAFRIAWELCFRRVVLVGCDWEMSAEKEYWFAQSRTKKAIDNNLRTYSIQEGFFAELEPVFAAAGFAVVNATPGSKLTSFPLVDLGEEAAAAAVDTGGSTDGMYDKPKERGRNCLRQYLLHNIPVHICQPEVAALTAEGELLMIEA